MGGSWLTIDLGWSSGNKYSAMDFRSMYKEDGIEISGSSTEYDKISSSFLRSDLKLILIVYICVVIQNNFYNNFYIINFAKWYIINFDSFYAVIVIKGLMLIYQIEGWTGW